MKTSPAGVAKIIVREGSKLLAYKDTVGVWTIGIGHTGRATPPLVRKGMRITAEQEMEILAADLKPFEDAVNRALKVAVTQNEYDAMVSLAFNIGVHGIAGSTVVHMVNAGNMGAAANAFLMWDHPAELLGRRQSERAQFLEHAA